MRAAFTVPEPRSAALRALNYRPEIEAFRKLSGKNTVALGSLLSNLGESYWQVFTRLDCDLEHGVELISQTDMFAAEPEGRVIRIDSMPRPEIARVCRWQVLIAGAGQMHEGTLFGRSIIADRRLEGKYLGPHAVGLKFEDQGGDVNLWTYAFLNTEVGRAAIKSCAFGTSVPGLRLDLLGELPVPIPDDVIIARIAKLIRETVEQREAFAGSISAARRTIEDLPEMQEALSMCSKPRARLAVWRDELPSLSARVYAHAGGALERLRQAWATRFHDVLQQRGYYTAPRFARIPCEPRFGVELMAQRDLFLIRPLPQTIAPPSFGKERLMVNPGTLLVGCIGTMADGTILGKTAFVDDAWSRKCYSQNILRVAIEKPYQELGYAYLSTRVGVALLRSLAVGSAQANLRPDLLADMPFPDVSPTQRQTTSHLVQIALAARSRADECESEAIRIVEEEVLPQWLG